MIPATIPTTYILYGLCGVVTLFMLSWSKVKGSGLFFGVVILGIGFITLEHFYIIQWLVEAYKHYAKWIIGLIFLFVAWGLKISLITPYEQANDKFMDLPRQLLVLLCAIGVVHISYSIWIGEL